MENEVNKKVCKACAIDKELNSFPKSKENRDGRHGKCRECVKNKVPIPVKVVEVKEGYKTCTLCEEELELQHFVKDKHRADGLASNCKKCRKQNREKIKNAEKTLPTTKKCNKCELIKDEKEFNRNSNSYSGLDSACKSCRTDEYYKKLENKIYIDTDFKICTKCNIEKSINNFHKSISSRDNHNQTCITCCLAYGKIYYEENREQSIEYSRNRRKENPERVQEINKNSFHKTKHKHVEKRKQYRIDNKDKISQANKIWRENNKEYIKQKKKEYLQNNRHIQKAWLDKRKAEDPLFKMAVQIRVNFNNIFNKILDNKLVKNKSSSEILCCSFEDFFSHIEKQFLPWMTFSNHGLCKEDSFDCSWHFDHIIPVSEATTEEEVYLLNHWSNFQPMCGKRNLSKNNKFYPCTNLELGITFWKNNWVYLKENDKKGF